MKKIILSFALAITCVTAAFAQKQTGGEMNFEVQFTPFGTTPIGLDGLRFRYFLSENSALRVRLGYTSTMDKTVRVQQAPVGGGSTAVIPELYDVDKVSNFGIRIGYEKHFAGTDRLSPYVGAEILFGTGKESLESEFHSANNATDVPTPEKYITWTITQTKKTSTIGFSAFAGTDFYFVDNFYLGLELGLGLQSKTFKDLETEVSDVNAYKYSGFGTNGGTENSPSPENFDGVFFNGEKQTVEIKTIIGDGDGNFKSRTFGTTVQPTLRLGWIFN